MPPAPRKLSIDATIPSGKVDVSHEIQIRTAEEDEDKAIRRRKEHAEFCVKDLGPYVLAYVIIALVMVYVTWALFRAGSPAEERQWAMSIVTTILAGVVGLVFGRATK
jgi:hypothetical protein